MRNKRIPSSFIQLLWPLLDWLLQRIYHIRPLRAGGSIICLEIKRYNSQNIILLDGTEVKPGDRIIELHMNDAWFKEKRELNLKAAIQPWVVLQSFAQDLSFLAEEMAKGTYDKITALHGCTFLGIGARRLGFQIEKLPDSLWKNWAHFYLIGLMQIHHLRTEQRLKVVEKPLELEEIWLSRAALLRRYSPRHY